MTDQKAKAHGGEVTWTQVLSSDVNPGWPDTTTLHYAASRSLGNHLSPRLWPTEQQMSGRLALPPAELEKCLQPKLLTLGPDFHPPFILCPLIASSVKLWEINRKQHKTQRKLRRSWGAGTTAAWLERPFPIDSSPRISRSSWAGMSTRGRYEPIKW